MIQCYSIGYEMWKEVMVLASYSSLTITDLTPHRIYRIRVAEKWRTSSERHTAFNYPIEVRTGTSNIDISYFRVIDTNVNVNVFFRNENVSIPNKAATRINRQFIQSKESAIRRNARLRNRLCKHNPQLYTSLMGFDTHVGNI